MSTSVSDILAALKTAWDGEPTLSVFGGPYRDREPASPAPSFPYVIIKVSSSTLDGMTNLKEHWLHTIEFTAYDVTPELASSRAGLISDVFDTLLPTLAASKGRIARVRRESEVSSEQTKGVHSFTLTYEYLRSKSRD